MEARKEYKLTVEEIQKLTESYKLRGRAYYINGNYGEAIIDFAKCIKYGQKNAEYYRWRAWAIRERLPYYYNYYKDNDEKIKKAIKVIILDLTKCIELSSCKDIYDYYLRGYFYLRQNSFDAAIKDFTKCINMILEKEKEKTEIAVEDLRKAIESNDNCKIEYYYRRGLSYFGKNNYDAAIEDFTEAIELSYEHVNSYYWRSRAYYESKNYSAALEDINNALEISPDFESAKKLKWDIIFKFKL
jgi:tetratricopeptide (TPR) repeat protein